MSCATADSQRQICQLHLCDPRKCLQFRTRRSEGINVKLGYQLLWLATARSYCRFYVLGLGLIRISAVKGNH